MAAPLEQLDSSLEQVGRRVDIFVYDPKQEDILKRVGVKVEAKGE